MTAANKGLGKATARQFACEGAKFAICARSELSKRDYLLGYKTKNYGSCSDPSQIFWDVSQSPVPSP